VVDDHVDEAVFEHELGGLETSGQLDLDGLGPSSERRRARPTLETATSVSSGLLTIPRERSGSCEYFRGSIVGLSLYGCAWSDG